MRRGRALVIIALVACAPDARADASAACVEASRQGQLLRAKGALREAREALLACAAEECPRVVRSYCTDAAVEVEVSLPTMVVLASADGHDVTDVSVAVDGRPLLSSLDGRAIMIDPGPHSVRGSYGSRTVEEKIVLGQGEKNRKVVLAFGGAERARIEEPKAPERPLSTATTTPSRPIPALAWIAGGVSVVGLGSFTYFGLSGKGEYANLRTTCAPACSDADIARSRDRLLVADLSLGVAVVSAIVATVLVVTSR